MSIYFSSEIYNNFKKKIANNQPTFSILNEIENFSIKEAIDFANNTPNFKNIFIIFSGQQSFHNLATADFDLLFGLRLTGADRLSKKWNNGLFWNGKYKIYKSTPGEPGSIDKTSLASALYDKFRSNSLIIDVVNCKFDWHRLYNNNQKSLENFYSTLFNDLFKKITNLNNINLFFFGFSRGAIMGFYIIERLIKEEGLNNIKAFVTVDPVINPFKMKELNDLNIKWYRRDNGEWEHSAKRPPLSGTYLPSYNYFPVINKLENINCFNVFQRRSIIYSDKFIKMPVGSAVSNAISLNNMDDDLNEIIKTEKNSFERQLSQYDEIIKNHTPDMIEKQWKRMFKIAEKLAV